MPDAIKTIEGWRDELKVRRFLSARVGFFIFSLGRGKPKQLVERLWFTFKGRVLGSIAIEAIEENTGQYDGKLKLLYGDWKPGRILMRCRPPFEFLEEEVFHRGFQGWRYFDLEQYRASAAHAAAREDANMERILSAKSADVM